MRISEIKKLIRECILENENWKDNKDDEDEKQLPPIDPDIDTKPLDDKDIWLVSDIEGSKIGGTSMPHGFGYPNSPFRKGRKLTKKDLNQILYIRDIEGVSEENEEKQGKADRRLTYDFIKENSPWIFTFSSKSEVDKNKINYPFGEFFNNKSSCIGWVNNFLSEVSEILGFFKYWISFPTKELKGAAKYNRHWIKRFLWAKQTLKRYPTFVRDLQNLLNYLGVLLKHSLTNSENPSNYPCYISLYDTTRRLGGAEEGGWWYNDDDLIETYKVRDYKEARKVAVYFLRKLDQADLNGKPLIVLEKEKGGRGNKPPQWS